MNGRTTATTREARSPQRVDELELAMQKVARRRKVFSIVVLAPLTAALLISSVYTFAPFVGQDQSASQAAPATLEAAIDLGNAYYNVKKYDEAVVAYQQALEFDPRHVSGHFNLGLVYQAKGDLEKAADEWRLAARYSDSPKVKQQVADLLKAAGKPQ
jgi:tetratricopeptide (TPR) repeat protein